jgi:hypothetical protein
VIGRDEQDDGVANGLLCTVAVEAGGGGIPARDRAVESPADDGVLGGLDDGGEPRACLRGGLRLQPSALRAAAQEADREPDGHVREHRVHLHGSTAPRRVGRQDVVIDQGRAHQRGEHARPEIPA